MKIRDNIKRVLIDSIKPNPWNPNVQSEFIFEREISSIKQFGMVQPILVRSNGGAYEIIDGEHRWRACKKEGFTEIPVNDLGEMDDVTAQQLTILLNEIRGKSDSAKLSDLLACIESQIGRVALEAVMPFSQSELDSLLNNANIDWDSLSPKFSGDGENKEGWKIIKFDLPDQVADQLLGQIDRFKRVLHPNDKDLSKVSPVMSIEAICQCLAQTPEDQLI
jgi:hypothetical protein